MDENMGLIKEINELRRVIKGTKYDHIDEGNNKQATNAVVGETMDAIEEQRNVIGDLKRKISGIEEKLTQMRPVSSQRLPPMGMQAAGELPPMDGDLSGPAV